MKQTSIILIGDHNSGKTSLINAINNESIDTCPTIYQEFRKIQIEMLQIQIFDCPGDPSQKYNIQQTVSVAAIAIDLQRENPLMFLEYHYHFVKDKPLIFFIGCKSDQSLHDYNAIKHQISKILKIQNVKLFITSALNIQEITKFKADLLLFLQISNQVFDLQEETMQPSQYAYQNEEQESSFLEFCSQLYNCCFCLNKEQ